MADAKKKKGSGGLFTHWARPRVRTYQYNFEYGESYYRPLVKYISTSKALSAASVSSSVSSVETKRTRLERRRRAGTPPGALSFIERWTNEPFYGYGVGFQSRQSAERTFSSSTAYESSSSTQMAYESSRSVRARSVAAVQQQQSSSEISRSSRARSIDIVAKSKYASDDCLMRSTALNSAISASQDILNTSSLTKNTLVLDNQNVLHGKTLDEKNYMKYPQQHLVCPENCPLHNNPEWRRRFLIGNRFLDAAALGGFDVLYDPSVYKNSRRLLAKLSERSESESEEILIERSSESESSKRKLRATSYFA